MVRPVLESPRVLGFAVDEGTREVVARIYQRLDGVPLAIELAAARLRASAPSVRHVIVVGHLGGEVAIRATQGAAG